MKHSLKTPDLSTGARRFVRRRSPIRPGRLNRGFALLP